jgi:hypothetical protein
MFAGCEVVGWPVADGEGDADGDGDGGGTDSVGAGERDAAPFSTVKLTLVDVTVLPTLSVATA